MATHDQTRSAFYPAKHYSSVRMQQGRVLTDDDFNEARRIDEEAARRTRVDVIGPAGSPDDGFKVEAPEDAGGQLDFTLEAGSFYLGGLRLELEADTTFRLQKDWLTRPPVAAPDAERRDFVYLAAWEQPVSAVEDEELFEPALGGPDTSSRNRIMSRVLVHAGVAEENCEEAFESLKKDLQDSGQGTVGPDYSVRPDTRLVVGFSEQGEAQDLCSPDVSGGFLGAENQAIRVGIVDDNHFTWGFDNASALYRARLAPDGVTVTLESEPPDELHWPLAGKIVELMPWGAVLENGEKLAEDVSPGHFTRVATSYDPDTRELTLVNPMSQAEAYPWAGRADAAELRSSRFGQVGPQQDYVFLRVWDRGDDTISPPAIPIAADAPLGTTGLMVTFQGGDRPRGAHWIIAARPETPDLVTPWQLGVGRPPEGFRIFVTPLAFIHWVSDGDGGLAADVEDCRKVFLPLTDLRSGGQRDCFDLVVGEGPGEVGSIQEAIDLLPAEGGAIHILPGTYRETLKLNRRRDIVLHGCGPRTRLLAPANTTEPTVQLRDCHRIRLEGMHIEAREGRAIEMTARPYAELAAKEINPEEAGLREIVLEALVIHARDRAAIVGLQGLGVAVRGCSIRLVRLLESRDGDPSLGREPAIYLSGHDLEVTDNHIEGEDSDAYVRTAAGGVHIGGRSRRVVVRGNTITVGHGRGIVLGSWRIKGSLLPAILDPAAIENPEASAESEGDLYEVILADNHIHEMADDGIAVDRFFDPESSSILIGVRGLVIEGNHIHDCWLGYPDIPFRSGAGGVALADCENAVLRHNVIENNGGGQYVPACGIFLLVAQGVEIAHNIIRGNDQRYDQSFPPNAEIGFRGGIVIAQALPPFGAHRAADFPRRITDRQDAQPAVSVHHNTVIAEVGRALEIVALGPVMVTDNQLASVSDGFNARLSLPGKGGGGGQYGFLNLAEVSTDTRTSIPLRQRLRATLDVLGGASVAILDLGLPNDFYFYLLGFSTFREWGGVNFDLTDETRQNFYRGSVMFNDNQVAYDAHQPTTQVVSSAVLLLSLDDVAAQNNQLTCDSLQRELLVTDLLALGTSVRAQGNRFEESFLAAALSSTSLALMNDTSHNQGTHCFHVSGVGSLSARVYNRSLLAWQASSLCQPLNGQLF